MGEQAAGEAEEQVRRLLAAAAEPGRPPRPPGPQFTDRARRSLARRRTVLAAGVVAVLAVAVAVPLALGRMSGKGDEVVPTASEACLRSAVREINSRKAAGYQPVSGTLRPGRLALDDGVTQSSGFRFEIETTLARGGVPSSGPVTVWYPAAEAQLPAPGRYVLLLAAADRPGKDGERLFEMAPEQVRRIGDDGKVRLKCGDEGERAVEPQQLRAAIAGSAGSAAGLRS
ncbi:hypothetical protein [Streptomyces sp. MST-110588]|uniref:hypothetical protein n=1 Tax=Streptomyces sp. MST-110588 TaxID=2833628 RepID=UPI001F5C8F9B|nr:hypothetical protein [Streptomyces sp. MST-110588]UNO38519.1 hypothetical protein KGS77_01215 [Streptomyces sp. MST-110588]